MKLSYSKVDKYNTCPKMYDFHYNKRFRSKYIGSPLFFGTALDDAVGRLLLEKKKTLTDKEKEEYEKTALEIFQKKMKVSRYNGEWVDLKKSPLAEYSKTDLDISLLSDQQMKKYLQEVDDVQSFIDWATKARKHSGLSEEDTLLYNSIGHDCLIEKGKMILKTYEAEIIPQIKEVLEIQKKIWLPNDEGDGITGFIDFTCIFNDEPDKKYIVDNKSSSKPYKIEQLHTSDQLHTYAEHEGYDDICYIVYEKNIRKREPRVRITILRGKTIEEQFEKTFEQYQKATDGIKNEEFNPNYDSGCFFYGSKCVYHSICHYNKMNDNLVNLNKKSNND